MSTNDYPPLRVGIVGFGRIGAEHAGWIAASGAACVAGVYDPTPARRTIAEQRGLRTVGTLDALLDDRAIDAVLVATPTSMHEADALHAIDAGKHVMIEKPVALDAAGAVRLRDAALARGVTLSVFQCRRWDVDFLTVRRLIAGGTLGRVFNVESRLGQFASCVGPAAREYRPGWRNEAAFGGGGLYDWGSHFVDQLWQLMRPARPARVFAQLRGNVWTADCDDFARILIDFDDGRTGLCEINTTTTRPLPRWHLDGTLGSASSGASPSFDTCEWAALTHTRPDGTTSPAEIAPAGLSEAAIWAAFATACRDGTEPPVTMESVLMTMRLLDAARASSREGRAVAI